MKKNHFLKDFFLLLNFFFISGIALSSVADQPILSDELKIQLEENSKKNTDRLNTLIAVVKDMIKGEKNFDIAHPYMQEIVALSDYLDDDYGKAYGQYFLGLYYFDQAQLFQSIQCSNKAQNMVEMLPETEQNQNLAIRVCLSLSACYGNCNMYPEKLQQIQKGLNISQKMGNQAYESLFKGHLAGLKAMMDEYEESIKIQQQLLQDTSLSSRIKYIYNYNIGQCFTSLKVLDSALFYYSKAAENIQIPSEKSFINYNMGEVSYDLGNYETAEKYYLEALPNMSSSLQPHLMRALAKVYLKKKQYQKALEYADKSINANSKRVLLDIYVDAVYTKVMILKAMGKAEESLDLLLDYVVLKDSLTAIRSVDKVNEMIIQQEVKMAENQMQAKIQSTKEKQQYVFGAVVISLILVIIIVLLLLNRKSILLRNRKIFDRAENIEKNFKIKELKINVLSQSQKNEILNEVVDRLLIFLKTTDNASEKTSSFIVDLKKSFKENSLKDFDYYFEQTYPDFYQKIKTDFPAITPNELRLCAALKLNITLKEVALINNISDERVNALYDQLQKTLNLTDSDIQVGDFLKKY